MGSKHVAVSDNASRSFFLLGDGEDAALSERASKLVSALYLVTSLVPESDPVRVELRRVGVALVSDMAKTSGGVRAGARDLVSVILSLLELSRNAGVMSVMNAKMLSEKFLEFAGALSAQGTDSVGHSALSMLSGSFGNSVKDITRSADASERKGHRMVLFTPNRRESVVRQITGRGSGDGMRRNKIVDFIKDKKRVGIKEISRIFPGLSEKTVQRELLTLVKANILNREGERRWSVYTIT